MVDPRSSSSSQPSSGPQPDDGHQATPGSPAGREGLLREMGQRLRRHSALEDLGPLFGPEAQGRTAELPPSSQASPLHPPGVMAESP